MSLIVSHLTKIYGSQKAVDDISFKIAEGEIVGFLGPNGAGKSTTMKIATGYIPPTAGEVIVNGIDVVGDPIAVKAITGYLPEHNPLYPDMYVHEYLEFVGGIYGLRGRGLQSRVSDMINQCGLEREQNKKIESLSKGYRQRVGLAQALIHDPKILILDEPTSGLDPNQLVEIRKLIKDISKNKTVLFSTHIMQEVEAICNRVIVINRGKLVADDSLTNLLAGGETAMSFIVEFAGDVDVNELKAITSIMEVITISRGTFRIIPVEGQDVRGDIFRMAADKGLSLLALRKEENSLEAIFQELTR